MKKKLAIAWLWSVVVGAVIYCCILYTQSDSWGKSGERMLVGSIAFVWITVNAIVAAAKD